MCRYKCAERSEGELVQEGGGNKVFYFDTDGDNDGPPRDGRRKACGEQVFHGRAMRGAGQGAPERQRITFHS